MPPESRGYEVLVFIKAPTIATSWAASRARREEPADLKSLWDHCPRADWLLKIALAAGLEGDLVQEVAMKLLADNGANTPQAEDLAGAVEAVAILVDEQLAANLDLRQLEDEALDLEAVSRSSDMGMHDDKIFESRLRAEEFRATLNRELSDPVRRLISYEQLRAKVYGAVQQSPYR